jgi:molybdopterin/thiamine biosynthesis adenylyltransferase
VNDSLQEKYSRQVLFAGIGPEGQERLLASRAVIVGCGAIGAAAANLLVRAGVGYVRIIDRDFVEPSNLQRQTLFDESDALQALPKAVVAEGKLHSINSSVAVEGIVADVSPLNVRELLAGVDLLLDGTDNFETRFLLNDFSWCDTLSRLPPRDRQRSPRLGGDLRHHRSARPDRKPHRLPPSCRSSEAPIRPHGNSARALNLL